MRQDCSAQRRVNGVATAQLQTEYEYIGVTEAFNAYDGTGCGDIDEQGRHTDPRCWRNKQTGQTLWDEQNPDKIDLTWRNIERIVNAAKEKERICAECVGSDPRRAQWAWRSLWEAARYVLEVQEQISNVPYREHDVATSHAIDDQRWRLLRGTR